MPKQLVFHAEPRDANQRLDKVLAERLASHGFSREAVKTLVLKGGVQVDGAVAAKPNFRLRGDESIEIETPDPTPASIEAQPGQLVLLHADASVAVLNKPPGLVVHPGAGQPDGTLANRLLARFPQIASQDGLRPGIVHRLDKDTSGLMCVAMTEAARLKLSQDFADRTVRKEYLALVQGRPEPETGVLTKPIGRCPVSKVKMAVAAKGGKPARTDYQTLLTSPDGRSSLVRCRLHTGRTHQIRVHLANLGHPLIGDAAYGFRLDRNDPALARLANRQMLHAWRLGFQHPETGLNLSFLAPPPRDFTRCLLRLWRKTQRIIVTGMPGSGKSTVLRALAAAGLPTFSADACVAKLYEPGADGWTMLVGRYGTRFLAAGEPDAAVDKAALLRAMLDADALRREVMDLIHPMVRARLGQFWEQNRAARAAAAEIPLFFETGDHGHANWLTMADIVVGVHCPQATRRERLAQTRGWNSETFAALESWQWPEAKKIAACDLVVANDGDIETLQRRCASLARVLADIRRGRVRRLLARLGALWGKASPENDAA